VSSIGANPWSRSLYPRTKGEIEDGARDIGFGSLDIVRPSFLAAQHREVDRPAERWALRFERLLRPVLPKRWRTVDPGVVVGATLACLMAGEIGERIWESETLAGLADGSVEP
jgi:uncharacterized protein YbjT (DUF2867 family)